MDSDQKLKINYINSTLETLPKYNFNSFVEDSIEMKTVLSSPNKNQSNLINSLNILRSILKENKKIFCPLFLNLFEKFLLIFKTENINLIPNEAFFLLFDLMQTQKSDPALLRPYYKKKWEITIIETLMNLYSILKGNENSNLDDNLKLTISYVEFLLDFYFYIENKNISKIIPYFSCKDKNLQKISAFLFFKYISKFKDIKEILENINWKDVFDTCSEVFNGQDFDEECKNICKEVYKQIYGIYQGNNQIIDQILYEGKLQNAVDFQKITGYNTTNVKEQLKSKVFE